MSFIRLWRLFHAPLVLFHTSFVSRTSGAVSVLIETSETSGRLKHGLCSFFLFATAYVAAATCICVMLAEVGEQ